MGAKASFFKPINSNPPFNTSLKNNNIFSISFKGSPIRAGQSLLTGTSPQKLLSGGGFTVVSPGSAKQQIILSTADFETTSVPTCKPTKTGSLCIFFRKVYHVAHLRLDFLCHTLEITEDVKRKIWTAFEYTIRSQTDLMKDRHLDQLLMCSLYIVCKVCE